jgi:hypothetical protein
MSLALSMIQSCVMKNQQISSEDTESSLRREKKLMGDNVFELTCKVPNAYIHPIKILVCDINSYGT